MHNFVALFIGLLIFVITGRGQIIKMLDFELAQCLFPFHMKLWFQKHKDELKGLMGTASRVVYFAGK